MLMEDISINACAYCGYEFKIENSDGTKPLWEYMYCSRMCFQDKKEEALNELDRRFHLSREDVARILEIASEAMLGPFEE